MIFEVSKHVTKFKSVVFLENISKNCLSWEDQLDLT